MYKYIAEIGWNFLGDMGLAEEMIGSAARAGANVVKFQYWDPANLTEGAWDDDGRRQIYEKAFLTEEKLFLLKDAVESHGCDFLISVFSVAGANYISDLGIKAVKIPSHESYNLDLIQVCLDRFDSIYISVGACDDKELSDALELVNESSKDICLMHCVSSYPLKNGNANLRRVGLLAQLTRHSVGYSDHTESVVAPAIAMAQGATVIEKHFTTNNDLPGRDNKFALTTDSFAHMINYCREAEELLAWKGSASQEVEIDVIANYRGRWAK